MRTPTSAGRPTLTDCGTPLRTEIVIVGIMVPKRDDASVARPGAGNDGAARTRSEMALKVVQRSR